MTSAVFSLLQEELTTLSNVRNLVSQLYEALNVEEHQLKKEREILAKLEDLKVQLAPMEKVNVALSDMGDRRVRGCGYCVRSLCG